MDRIGTLIKDENIAILPGIIDATHRHFGRGKNICFLIRCAPQSSPPPALQATEIDSKRMKKDQEIVIHGNIIIER